MSGYITIKLPKIKMWEMLETLKETTGMGTLLFTGTAGSSPEITESGENEAFLNSLGPDNIKLHDHWK